MLRNPGISPFEVEDAVQLVGHTCVATRLTFAPNGHLYLTDVEQGAIRRLTQAGALELIVQDPRLAWPDSMAFDTGGVLYLTTAATPPFAAKGPFQILQLEIKQGTI